MDNINYNEPVTKGLLTAFGTKSKKIFKRNPLSGKNIMGSNWTIITTNLEYNSINGYDALYLNILGISDNDISINSNFYLKADVNNILICASGINLGSENIILAVFYQEDDVLKIALKFLEGTTVDRCIVDSVATNVTSFIPEVITSVSFSNSFLLGQDWPYELIYLDGTTSPFSKEPIGNIIIQLLQNTNFYVVENYDPNNESIKHYPGDYVFDKIDTATKANKLSHSLNITYDFDNPFSDGDLAAEIGNGSLSEDNNSTITIPIPNVGTGITGNFYQVSVDNGFVTGGDENIPQATTTQTGGFKLYSDSSVSFGSPVYVQLNSEGLAFISIGELGIDIHRDDLTKLEYLDTYKYANRIFLHIGETSGNFVNGYFYKSVLFDNLQSPYSVEIESYDKLNDFIINNDLPIDINSPIKIYVSPEDYDIAPHESGGITTYTKLCELSTFKMINVNNPNTVVTLSKSDLEYFHVFVKTTGSWGNALAKDYPIETMDLYLSFNDGVLLPRYIWSLWDVQPKGENIPIDYISNELIDYLFETHVSEIHLEETSKITAPGEMFLLKIEDILPADAPHKEVVWESDSPLVIVMPDVDPEYANVVISAEAEAGDYIITCRSVYEPNVLDRCILTIN